MLHTIGLITLIACLELLSCKHEATIVIKTIEEVKNPYQLPLQANFSQQGDSNSTSSITFAIWMFKNDHIANWLNKHKDGKEVLEPVNVLWIDYRSETPDEAKTEVSRFLGNCGFDQRKGSSTGYFTFMGTEENPVKTGQYPSDKTWSDGNALQDNNHGRIFIRRSTGGKAFYTLGAFSRETGISHHFISFNAARDKMKSSGNWKREELITDFQNIFPVQDSLPFSTFDHNGTVLFVLTP